ncbi:MAG: hypothetical protein JWQ03_456 [Variovorax sp.]|nr:hypothetical protein [Variovorax sp.]
MIFPDAISTPTRSFLASSDRMASTVLPAGPDSVANETPEAPRGDRALYECLLRANGAIEAPVPARQAAHARIEQLLDHAADAPCGLPDDPDDLADWMARGVASAGLQYRAYLARRKAGGHREYFTSRSHALHFLRAVAPTKLVDGAWLYGLLPQWRNPRFADLVRTYVEELGGGLADKNHVLLYRRLLQSHGIDDWREQPDANYTQGALQLALATCADAFLPELIGFNLGYEQLPLHLLITAYELDELGIDPYYFSLHVTVDNAAGGHARCAVRAVHEALPGTGGADAFWRRVRNGFKLNDTGLCTTAAIAGFDLHAEFLRVLQRKTVEGRVAHSDYCRIEGRSVNEWLDSENGVVRFVDALERKGWLRRGKNPAESRFWRLLQGERAEMFGVFSPFELQVVYDWIRGDDCRDGAAFPAAADAAAPRAPRSFRQQYRLATLAGHTALATAESASEALDPDIAALERQLVSQGDARQQVDLLLRLMGPAHHWSMAGLHATRIFAGAMLHA